MFFSVGVLLCRPCAPCGRTRTWMVMTQVWDVCAFKGTSREGRNELRETRFIYLFNISLQFPSLPAMPDGARQEAFLGLKEARMGTSTLGRAASGAGSAYWFLFWVFASSLPRTQTSGANERRTRRGARAGRSFAPEARLRLCLALLRVCHSKVPDDVGDDDRKTEGTIQRRRRRRLRRRLHLRPGVMASVAEARRRDGELSAADGECGETANRRRVAKSAASWRRVAF